MSAVPNNPIAPLVHPKLSATKDDPSLRHLTDETVTTHIYTKHREDDRVKIDVDNYIALVESIITTADRITETVTQVFISYLCVKTIRYNPPCYAFRLNSNLTWYKSLRFPVFESL